MDTNQISPSIGSVAQQTMGAKEFKGTDKGFTKVDVPPKKEVGGQRGVNNSLLEEKEVDDKQPVLIEDIDELDSDLSKINDFFQDEQRKLSFAFKKEINDVVIEVRDLNTDELVRQIPSELVVKIAEHLNELAEDESTKTGVLLQEKV